jgi:hypothetical protein
MYKTAAAGHNLYQMELNPTGDYVNNSTGVRYQVNIVNWVDTPVGPNAISILGGYIDFATVDAAMAYYNLTYSPIVPVIGP